MNRSTPSPRPDDSLPGYRLYGSGAECVLVLHDWLGDQRNYDAVLPFLDTTTFTYAFVDLRGYGQSLHLTGCYSLEEMARDCLRVADHLCWQHLHLLGHSMSAMVVQRIAANQPSRVKSVIAVCPISAAGNRLPPPARAFFASTCHDDEALRRLFGFVSPGLPARWIESKLRQNRERVAAGCREAYLDMMTGTQFVEDVRGLETPILVLVGDKDPGLDADAMQDTFLAWYPNARVVTLANSGHYPMQECPLSWVRQVEDFLREGHA